VRNIAPRERRIEFSPAFQRREQSVTAHRVASATLESRLTRRRRDGNIFRIRDRALKGTAKFNRRYAAKMRASGLIRTACFKEGS
jgi:hypothetical protein